MSSTDENRREFLESFQLGHCASPLDGDRRHEDLGPGQGTGHRSREPRGTGASMAVGTGAIRIAIGEEGGEPKIHVALKTEDMGSGDVKMIQHLDIP